MDKVIQTSVEKAKVGPLTGRYSLEANGFVDVDPQPDDEPDRYVVCGLDNSHNGDYKVAYASDPVLVFTAAVGDTHDDLKRAILAAKGTDATNNGELPQGLTPIQVAHSDGYKPGYKSLPRDANMVDLWMSRFEHAVEREHDILQGESGATAYIPVE